MPFPTALASPDHNQRRAGIYNAERYLVVFTGSIQMQFNPDANASGNSNSQITYSSVLSGGTSNVINNMTVIVSPTSDYIDDLQNHPDNCLITYTRQAPTASIFYIGETAYQWTTSSYVTVLDDFRVHEKRTIVGNTNIIYKNVALTRQNPRPRIYDLYDDVVVTSAPSVSYSPTPNATAMTSGGSISSWSWDTISNGTVSKAASTSQNPTFTLALGTHWLVLTATDNGGLTHSLAVKVAVVPRNFDSVVENAFVDSIQYDMNNGGAAGLTKWDDATSIVPGSPCLIFAHVDYTNGITEDYVELTGWLGGAVVLDLSASDEWGQLKSYEDSVKTIRSFAEAIRLPAFPVREKTSPSVWGEMTRTGIYDAIWYIVSEHSTIANLSAQDYPSNYADYRFPTIDTPGGTMPDIIEALAYRASGDMINYSPNGELIFAKSLLYETTDANRDNATVYGTFTIDDTQNVRTQRSSPGLYGLSAVLAGFATYNTTTAKPRIYRSQAPAGFVPTVLLEEVDGIIMAADLSDTNAKAQAGKFTANHFFAGVESHQVFMDMITGYRPYPRGGAWVKLTLAASDTLDGSSFDSNDRFLVTALTSQWDNEAGRIINSVSLRKETTGGDNYANETVFVPLGTVQTIPTFPIQNGYPDLSDYEDGSSYYGNDFDDWRDGWEDNTLPPENAANSQNPNSGVLETLYVPFKGGAINTSFNSTLSASYLVRVSNLAQIGQAADLEYDFTSSNGGFSAIAGTGATYEASSGWKGVKVFGTTVRLGIQKTVSSIDVTGGSLTALAASPTHDTVIRNLELTLDGSDIVISETPPTGTSNPTHTFGDDVSGVTLLQVNYDVFNSGGISGNIYITALTINSDAILYGDAFFSWDDGDETGTAYSGQGGLNLDGSGIVHGNSYNGNHVYEFTITGTGNPFTFSFTDPDGDYTNNENLALKVELIAL